MDSQTILSALFGAFGIKIIDVAVTAVKDRRAEKAAAVKEPATAKEKLEKSRFWWMGLYYRVVAIAAAAGVSVPEVDMSKDPYQP